MLRTFMNAFAVATLFVVLTPSVCILLWGLAYKIPVEFAAETHEMTGIPFWCSIIVSYVILLAVCNLWVLYFSGPQNER